MVTQDANGFKHVAMLRKLILEKRSGTAWFGGEGWENEINFEKGAVLTDASEHITQVLEEPVFHMGWKKSLSSRRQQSTLRMPPRQIFTQAIAAMDMPVKRMIAYRKQLEKLPNIRIRYMSSFRSNPDYQAHFQALYHMSLASNGVSLADYFAAAGEIAELRKRVNIVIAAYCFGDMVAVNTPALAPAAIAGTEKLSGEALGRVSIVSRILTKLREGKSL